MPTSIGLLCRPARCRTAVHRGNLKSQASCTSAPAHAALSRQRALRVAPLVVISLLGAVDSSLAKKSPPPPPPKTEYELMMENLQKEGKAPTDEAVNKVFDKVRPKCIEYGGEVSSNYASGMGRYYDCTPADKPQGKE